MTAGGVMFAISLVLMVVGPLDRALSKRKHSRSAAPYGAALRSAYHPSAAPPPEIDRAIEQLDAIPPLPKT